MYYAPLRYNLSEQQSLVDNSMLELTKVLLALSPLSSSLPSLIYDSI